MYVAFRLRSCLVKTLSKEKKKRKDALGVFLDLHKYIKAHSYILGVAVICNHILMAEIPEHGIFNYVVQCSFAFSTVCRHVSCFLVLPDSFC